MELIQFGEEDLMTPPHACFHATRRDLLAAILVWVTFTASAVDADPIQLQLQARLFHGASGTFSKDALAIGGPELVNVIASADPSTATLVLVVVQLSPNTVVPSDSRVRLTAREKLGKGERLLQDRSLRVGPVARGGRQYVGFWLDGTGCRELRLEALLTVPGEVTPMRASAALPFKCQE